MTYAQALHLLNTTINFEKKEHYAYGKEFNLDRMRSFLNRLNNPHHSYPSVLIAGTNGKGSLARLLQNLLSSTHEAVGLYTSPHLIDIRERISINGKKISNYMFGHCCEYVFKEYKQFKKKNASLTYFELLTAIAFVYFARKKISYLVCEVGLGGRLDATNVLAPRITIFSSIGLDHMHLLGKKIEAIAREKAGIIKRKTPIFSLKQRAPVMQILHAKAHENEAPLYAYGKSFFANAIRTVRGGIHFSFNNMHTFHIPFYGAFQAENAALALAVHAYICKQENKRPNVALLRKILGRITMPGRFDIVTKRPTVILDGAHNQDAIANVVKTLKQLYPQKKIYSIFAASRDKQVSNIFKELRKVTDTIVITKSNHARAYAIDELAKIAASFFKTVYREASFKNAFKYLKSIVSADSVIVITGSFFIVGEAYRLLKKE